MALVAGCGIRVRWKDDVGWGRHPLGRIFPIPISISSVSIIKSS